MSEREERKGKRRRETERERSPTARHNSIEAFDVLEESRRRRTSHYYRPIPSPFPPRSLLPPRPTPSLSGILALFPLENATTASQMGTSFPTRFVLAFLFGYLAASQLLSAFFSSSSSRDYDGTNEDEAIATTRRSDEDKAERVAKSAVARLKDVNDDEGQTTSTQPESPPRKHNRVLCWVPVRNVSSPEVALIRELWGRRCDKLAFTYRGSVTNDAMGIYGIPDLPPNGKDLWNIIHPGW